MSRDRRLEGQVVLVTGANRGIGRGIALALAEEGADVAINYVDAPERAAETVAAIERVGVRGLSVAGDVRVASDVARMVETVVSTLGGLTTMVNNAGVQTWAPLLDLTEAEWDRVLDTNLKGCFLCTQAAARHMKNHGGGVIVNIGSGCNRMAFAGLSSYTASKGGIEMFTKVSAVELGPFAIRVNCVAPGAIDVERTRLERADYAGAWGSVTPLGRVGRPEDVGRAVAWVASPDAAFITGQTIWVDGGLFCQPPWPGRA
jgi:NAD(P)-dependent dehydrogenase (short-subunit alcohol dehydrogenase family)